MSTTPVVAVTVKLISKVAVVGVPSCLWTRQMNLCLPCGVATGTVTLSANRVGYLFQEPRLLPWLTSERNIDFALDSCIDSLEHFQKVLGEFWHENF